MKVLVPQSEYARGILGAQSVRTDCRYRMLRYTKTMRVPEGLLIYNIFTHEFIILYNDELWVLDEGADVTSSTVGRTLIDRWVMVPEENDDYKLCMQFSDALLTLNRSRIGIPYKTFTILPTTDCNARCFYCFELSGSRKWMSEQTAHDVADFIDRKKASNKVNLRWFGGEPLYNEKAIDIISQDLTDKGIEFTSTMITNGYLFDEEMVKKAKDFWKVKWVQITLDGTEEIYNRIKAYIYKGENAFKRVIRNIGLLLDNGIGVRLRMNMDDHNEEDLFKLTEFLAERFAGYDDFLMYVCLLFEDSCARIAARDDQDRHDLIQKQLRLRDKIAESGHADRSVFYPKSRIIHCMCDNDNATMILPEGELGKCQHFTEEHFYGSIYSEEIDYEELDRLKDVMILDENNCHGCDYLPMCISLKACLILPHRCDKYDKMAKTYDMEAKIRHTYEKFKEKGEI